MDEFRHHPVRAALRHLHPVGDMLKRNAIRMGGKKFHDLKCPIEDAAGHDPPLLNDVYFLNLVPHSVNGQFQTER